MRGMTQEEKMAYRQESRAKMKDKREKRKDRRQGRQDFREDFKNQMVNREGGAMWGGYRNDGKPTNPNALTIGRGVGRGQKYNERRS